MAEREAVSQLIGALDTLLPLPSSTPTLPLRRGRRDRIASRCARAICDSVTMTRVFALRTFLWIFVCVDSISGQGKCMNTVDILMNVLNYGFFPTVRLLFIYYVQGLILNIA